MAHGVIGDVTILFLAEMYEGDQGRLFPGVAADDLFRDDDVVV